MRTVYTVGVRRYVAGQKDSHGNAEDTWAAPVPVPVYSIAPTTSSEPEPGRSEVVEGMTVLAPVGTLIGPQDRVLIDGDEWETDGDLADWSRGPFGWAPGVSINLKRAEG